MSSAASSPNSVTYLDRAHAQQVDDELMSPAIGFALEQLVELAGLACAQSVEHCYPLTEQMQEEKGGEKRGGGRVVLVVCGPGNNGADGLTCARHLRLFGYDVQVLYPKEPKNDLYKRLLQQLKALDVPVVDKMPEGPFALIVDAIFGFSFDPKDGIREPYKSIIDHLVSLQSSTPIASLDVPSGWDVSAGDTAGTGLKPELLVSLTAPKECARTFQGKWHCVGGRFMPPSLLKKLNIHLPPFAGSAQFQDISATIKKQQA